jgi:hypothetical protein
MSRVVHLWNVDEAILVREEKRGSTLRIVGPDATGDEHVTRRQHGGAVLHAFVPEYSLDDTGNRIDDLRVPTSRSVAQGEYATVR